MTRRILIGLLLSSSVSLSATGETIAPTGVELSGLIGYGIGLGSGTTTGPGNEYGFGLGARAGYTFPFRIYAGASFIYHFGTALPGLPSSNVRMFTLAAEIGYGIAEGPIEIRPFLGVGFANQNVRAGGSGSTGFFALMPGALLTYFLDGARATGLFLGADLHVTWLPSQGSGKDDLSTLATGGYRF